MTVDYTITNPHDPLYDWEADHPQVNQYFEWTIRHMSPAGKALHRRLRAERQEMKQRHSREIREFVQAERKAQAVADGAGSA